MAEIFLARGAGVAGVERYCVLKRILRERANDAQFVQMFIDEARLAAQLQHPNIASVYDIGMLGDSYFFTMEYVHGETIKSLVQRAQGLRRPLPVACVLTIIAGTAAGLHHAHERNGNDGRPLGIVHRDISPSNLMVSYEGNVKIVDFGVAKADDRVVKTQSGTVKGKISYLSPEQCRGTRVDRRSDLFSLGIVMWEMLTGARLYRQSSDFESMQAIVHEPPSPPSSRRPDVPRAIDDIVLRLLAKSVTDRFQTARDVVEAIENVAVRAGTILSISAVSHLIRDLFGTRAEPWLEYESETLPFQPSMIASRPLPKELGDTLPDPVERELAAVPDLALSGMFEEVITSDSMSSIDVETLQAGARASARALARRTTLPASPAARRSAPRIDNAGATAHAAPPAALRGEPGPLALPGIPSRPTPAAPTMTPPRSPPPPIDAAPLAMPGSQPVHVAGLAAGAQLAMGAPLPPFAAADTVPLAPPPERGATTLRDAGAPPPRSPVALPSATTLRTTAGGGAQAAPATARDAALVPTLIAAPAGPPLARTLTPPWLAAKATPAVPFEALPPADSGPARVGFPQVHPAAPPPSPTVQPPANTVPPHASSLTTAKWRPTRELALRVAPRLFTVIIPAATIGAILAWVLTHDEPRESSGTPPPRSPAPEIQGSPETPEKAATGPHAAAPSDAGVPAESAPADGLSSSSAPAPSTDAALDHDEPAIPTQGSGGEPASRETPAPEAPPTAGSDADRRGTSPAVPPHRGPDAPPPRPPPRSPGPSAAPGPGSVDLSILVKAMSKPKDCSGVASACRATGDPTRRAFYCFYAACCANDVDGARRLLPRNPSDSQKHLRTDCKQMGNPDVGIRPLDCAHNIRDCRN